MKKKKVLFVIHALGGGGAERVLINLIKTLNREKYDITLMTIVDSGIYRSQIPEDVTYKSVFSLPSHGKAMRKGNPKKKSASGSLLAGGGLVKKAIAKAYTFFWRLFPAELIYKSRITEQYDIEIAFLEGPCTKFVAASANQDSKKIAWIHVDLSNEGKSHSFYKSTLEETKTYGCFDRVVSVSEGVERSFLKLFPDCETKSLVLHNPIDVQAIKNLSKDYCPELEKSQSVRPAFLSVGRLCAQKAFERVIETAANLKEMGLAASFYILGEGPDRQKLEQLAQDYGVSDSVIFLGFRENPYPFFRCCDSFLCTSIAEGFSTTATEAAILGLPIFTTECAGMDELDAVYDSVYLCPNDSDEVKKLIAACVGNGTAFKAGSMYVPGYFDLSNRTMRVEELLDEVGNEE